jgi:hypothetical protein
MQQNRHAKIAVLASFLPKTCKIDADFEQEKARDYSLSLRLNLTIGERVRWV